VNCPIPWAAANVTPLCPDDQTTTFARYFLNSDLRRRGYYVRIPYHKTSAQPHSDLTPQPHSFVQAPGNSAISSVGTKVKGNYTYDFGTGPTTLEAESGVIHVLKQRGRGSRRHLHCAYSLSVEPWLSVQPTSYSSSSVRR
jgi:hypothetical protein